MQQALVQPRSAARVYYAQYLRHRSRWAGYIQLTVGVYNFIEGLLRHSRFNLIVGTIFMVIAPYVITQGRRIRLVIEPDGITYHRGLSVLTAPWGDMEHIGRSMQRLYPDYEGIILREVHWKSPLLVRRSDRWRPRFIPLWSRWDGPWWDREVFDDIFHYAPWLADSG